MPNQLRPRDAVIVATARTPFGRAAKGSLTEMRPDDLAAVAIAGAMARVPQLAWAEVEDLIVGCGLPGGEQGYNIARNIAVLLGQDQLPGMTLTRYCSSSLQAVRSAAHAIRANEGDVFVCAGVETVSRYGKGNSDNLPDTKNPRFQAAEARTELRSHEGAPLWSDPRLDDDLPDVYISMGQTAENVAQLKKVSREDQDQFAVRSQNLTEQSEAAGFWRQQIVPVTTPSGSVVTRDDSPRPHVTMEAVSGLPPVFRPDGTVTAGNACPLNDGAAAVVVMSAEAAQRAGITPLARVLATSVSGLSPEIMGLGPVGASRQALDRLKMSVDDVDLVEINEAFAAQVLPSADELGIHIDRLNVNGGSIAVGHPFGATGARLVGTLIDSLHRHDGQIGLETMCVGGGQGMALVLERLS